MSAPPTGHPGVILPGVPDPGQTTLHTCTDCGFQLLLPAGLVPAAVDFHRRGCVGPKLADLAERLRLITAELRGIRELVDGDSQDYGREPR